MADSREERLYSRAGRTVCKMRPNALAAAQVNQSNGTGRAPAKPLVQGSGGALIQAAPEQDKENATARPRDTPHVGPAATQHAPAAATPAPRAVSAELALPPGAHLSVGSLAVPLPVTTERVLTLLRVSSPGSLGSDPHDPNSTDRVPFEVHIPASYTDMSPELSDAVHAHAQHLARGIGGASPVTPVLEDVVVNVAPRLFADPWAAGRDAPPGSRGRMVVQLPSEFGHSADQVSAWKQGDVVGCRLFQRPFTQDTRLARTVALQPGTQHRVMTGLCCTVSLVFDLRSAQDEAARAAPARIQAEEEQPAPQTG
ncbi:unnamed protein product [Pedinophyceae sp. YPF-701]|nr:unnamed protein product [Pedinophyceae sp. YPF-701]